MLRGGPQLFKCGRRGLHDWRPSVTIASELLLWSYRLTPPNPLAQANTLTHIPQTHHITQKNHTQNYPQTSSAFIQTLAKTSLPELEIDLVLLKVLLKVITQTNTTQTNKTQKTITHKHFTLIIANYWTVCAGFVIRAEGLVGRQFAKFLQFQAVFRLAGLRDGRAWFHSLCKNGLKMDYVNMD